MNLKTMLPLRTDAGYNYYALSGQAKTDFSKVFYLAMYLLPGLLAFALINIEPIYNRLTAALNIPGNYYQYIILIFVTYIWHILLPFIVLRFNDKLTFRQSLDFLGLTRFDWKGSTYLQIVFLLAFTLLTLPYMKYIQRPLYDWLDAIPMFAIPDYSIFKTAEALYGFHPLLLSLLLIGNFVGEELYFRGYLQKKTAFLGRHNIWINGVLFSIYHFFQIPQTWPLIIPSIAFPLLMHWRKSLWVVIIFHFLVNLVWAPLIGWLLSMF